MNQNEKKTNTLAILGFIFSFLFSLLGLILSILGLKKSKETGSGKGLSIAGIVISSVSIAMSILIMLIIVPYYFSYDNDIRSSGDDNTTVTDNVTHYSHTFNVSSNDLYVDMQEEKMNNYSRETSIDVADNNYYINDGILYVAHNGNKDAIDLNGEQAKYLGLAQSSCSGSFLAILTQSGNIYRVDFPNSSDFPKKANLIYNRGNATEIITYTHTNDIHMTCSSPMLFALADNELYFIPFDFNINLDVDYKTRNEIRPYSVVYHINANEVSWKNDGDDSSILLYPDGKLNKYVYSYNNTEVKDEFVTDENGNNILVSFIFNMNKEIYIVDINGKVYKIVGPDNYSEEKLLPFTVERDLSFDKKIKSVNVDYTSKDYQQNYIMVFNYNNGTKKEYSTKNGDDIKFYAGYIK